MNPRTSTPIPTEPEALRALVLSLLQTQQEKEAEWAERARYIAQQELAIALRDETIARLESTIAKLQRWRFGRSSEKLSPAAETEARGVPHSETP
ncbi:hypothetical protein AFERRID_01030 [Acidithiobacillus ferridurans]|uniref:Transposase TnpC homeodomain domain-containing protein n=1 Tax=Acidithiobacillus ferridurans TaxID=1232575 RepID=A0A2Z6IIP4_ACIFI|nr:hypothetical protein A4U49_07695 [Acidithiobacillus ferrivorans]BBF63885.1 hypothetical protein AFERRID_01030 [Acidithiobacillus ferridurans]